VSEKCERCKRGYASGAPRDDVEWLETRSSAATPGRELRIARCTRCNSLLADLVMPESQARGALGVSTTFRERSPSETHDVCVVHHDQARSALIARDPIALAVVSPQLRRRHLEEVTSGIDPLERNALERIERGEVDCTEAYRGLVTRIVALGSTDLPLINDVRPHGQPRGRPSAAAVGLRTPLDLGDGSRAVVEVRGEQLTLARMRGDAVAWRTEIPTASKDAFLARVIGRNPVELVVLTGPPPNESSGCVFIVQAPDGTVRGPGRHDLRAASFEAHALPSGCTFVASYQHCMVIRDDAQVAWKGSATGFPVAVPIYEGVVVVDAPWRLVALSLPGGNERWAIPVDRGATLAPAGEGHVILTTSDVVARLDARGERPGIVWMAAGASPLALADGGAALVRERWEKGARVVECLVIDPDGARRFRVARPEATKAPTSELAPGVLLYHAAGDVAVSVNERVAYALASPSGSAVYVTVEDGGAWIEYDGIVDRVDGTGRRAGRFRVG
jgi:hypothetical protein